MPGEYLILAVEDEVPAQLLLREFLQPGFRIHFAKDGQAALAYFRQYHEVIDLILLDLSLPDMSGTELYHKFIQSTPGNVPNVVVTSASDSVSDWISTLTTMGAIEHLAKPFTRSQLLQCVQNALKTYHPTEQLTHQLAIKTLIKKRNMIVIGDYMTQCLHPGEIPIPPIMIKELDFSNTPDSRKKLIDRLVSESPKNLPEPQPLKILMVEDEAINQEIFKAFISSKNCTLISAYTLKEAQEILGHHSDITVILLDLNLPDGCGQEVITAVKNKIASTFPSQAPLLPLRPEIVVISAYSDKETISEVSREGVIAYINKPVSNDLIYKTAEEAHQMRSELTKIYTLLH